MTEEGEEFAITEPITWGSFLPIRGQVLEVYLPATDWESPAGLLVGLWVKEVNVTEQGEILVEVKSLGCNDAGVTKRLSNVFNRRVGLIHLCTEEKCRNVEANMHVRRLRSWSVEAFQRTYISEYTKRCLRSWLSGMPEGEDEKGDMDLLGDTGLETPPIPTTPVDDGWEPVPEKEAKSPKIPPPRKGPRASKAAPAASKGKVAGNGSGEKGIDRAELRQRLEGARARMLGQKPGAAVRGVAEDLNGPEWVPSSESEHLDLQREPLEDLDQEQQAQILAKRRERKKKIRALRKKEKEEAPKKIMNVGGRLNQVERGADHRAASSAGTTKDFQGQLMEQALEVRKERMKKTREEKRRQTQKDPAHQLAKILTEVVKGKDRKKGSGERGSGDKLIKKEKKEPQKSKKRKHRDGGDPGGDDPPTDDSYYSDWSGSEDGEADVDSSSDGQAKKLMGPLRRKSKANPGSVLQTLVAHARAQLDQSAKVQVGSELEKNLTGGVKISSYFAIVVRPQLGSSMAQIRELHHLAQAIDLLRQGDLSLLGDVLAGRFMSIHQSVLDGSWRTARHLELLPFEEGTAAAPEVVLEARRQAKIAEKLVPGDNWGWTNNYRGRGGRGRGSTWADSQNDTKGKGKKGGKGKGKYKGYKGAESNEGKQKEALPEK